MPVAFRNVDASPTDDVRTWPYEALVAVIDRGLVPDWQPVFAELRRSPWGRVARRVEHYLAYREPDPTSTLFALAVEHARAHADRELVVTHREPQFENLRVGHARVGHVAVHGARTVVIPTGPGTAANRLVVLVCGVAVEDVVHGALRGSQHADRAEQGLVANTMAGGDNCYRGAVLGALLGAENGPEGWPARWRENLLVEPVWPEIE